MVRRAWAVLVGAWVLSSAALGQDAEPHDGADAPAPEPEPLAASAEDAAAEASPAPARRKPAVTTLFTEDFELRYWVRDERLPDPPDVPVFNYVEQVNRLTGNVRVGPWSFYGQVDQVALMANTYFLDDVRRVERELMQPGTWSLLIPGRFDPATHQLSGWDLVSRNLYFNLEKVRFKYEKGPLSIALGDSYVAFGRGMALNVNRNVDIDIDTSLQGMKLVWRPGAWDITGVFGQLNRQQVFQDNPNIALFGDRRHTVGGVRIDRYGLGPANVGVQAVAYDFVEQEGWEAGFQNMDGVPDVVIAGGSVELLGLGPTDWYLEGNAYAHPTDDTFGGAEARTGYGLYLSSSIYAGPTTWTLEGKRYFETERVNALLTPELYEVSIGPSLEYERQITEDSSATMNSNDAYGGLVQMDWTAIPGTLVPYWRLAVYRDLDLSALHFNTVPETVYHPMIGVEYTEGDWAVLLNAGYRLDDRDGDRFGADRHLHGDVALKLPIAKGWLFDINLAAEWYRWGVNPIQQTDYVEMESALAVQKGSLVSFIWYTDYSTNPLIGSLGNLTPALYGAFEVKVQPLPALNISAFYGAYKAGIRCAGGQCRVLPGFEGARLALSASF